MEFWESDIPEEKLFPPEPIEKLSFLDVCYGILFQPRLTMSRIAETEPVYYGFLILVFVSVLNTIVSFSLVMPETLKEMQSSLSGAPIAVGQVLNSPATLIVGAILGIVFSVLGWLLRAAIVQLVAELLGGRGRGLGVLAVTGCAMLPMILVTPMQVLTALLGWPNAVAWLLALPITLWSNLVLPIFGIGAVHKFSLFRAFLTLLTPVLVVIGLIILVSVLVGIMLVPLFAEIGNI